MRRPSGGTLFAFRPPMYVSARIAPLAMAPPSAVWDTVPPLVLPAESPPPCDTVPPPPPIHDSCAPARTDCAALAL
eukprot:gene23304-27120_t